MRALGPDVSLQPGIGEQNLVALRVGLVALGVRCIERSLGGLARPHRLGVRELHPGARAHGGLACGDGLVELRKRTVTVALRGIALARDGMKLVLEARHAFGIQPARREIDRRRHRLWRRGLGLGLTHDPSVVQRHGDLRRDGERQPTDVDVAAIPGEGGDPGAVE